MVESFLHEHQHHLRMRVLLIGGAPLHREYAHGLKQHQAGQFSMFQWNASRSEGHWFNTVLALYNVLQEAETCELLDLRQAPPNNVEPLALDAPGIARDVALVKLLFKFVVELCSARCWSQLHHSLCLPWAFARVGVDSAQRRASARSFFQKLEGSLLKFDTVLKKNPKNEHLNALSRDIATLDWVSVREILITGHKVGWDLEAAELHQLCWSMFAAPSESKSSCENCFAWLSDSASRQSKANKFAAYTKMMYLMCCPYPESGGLPTLKPSFADVRQQTAEDVKEFQQLKPFEGASGPIPFRHVTAASLQKWRPAGFVANRAAAIATAYILEHASAEFKEVSDLWSGGCAARCCVWLRAVPFKIPFWF